MPIPHQQRQKASVPLRAGGKSSFGGKEAQVIVARAEVKKAPPPSLKGVVPIVDGILLLQASILLASLCTWLPSATFVPTVPCFPAVADVITAVILALTGVLAFLSVVGLPSLC